ncbi:septation protein A [Thaumasiovibrio sp. DFM-14]|uniref:septation protein A n=1 Tax=Thaumasiovibrio sp. DFM-14 TaxID=3384792 RepID=UPI0039A10AEB
MKQLIDFIPLIVFFVLFQWFDIYIATGALIVTTGLQMIILWFLNHRLEKSQLLTLVLVIVFGGMTILFKDDSFIKWKVTILYLIFSGGLVVSHWLKKPLIKAMLHKEISLAEKAWLRLNLAWAGFFLFCALLNLYVSYTFSLATWVNFKVFGLLGLTLLFTLGSGVFLYRHMPKDDESQDSDIPKG